MESLGTLAHLGYYTVKPETIPQIGFLNSLRRFGYMVSTKPLKIIKGENGTTVRKANFDVEIAVEAMDKITSYDLMILFSGDSDFNFLINKLHAKGKRVIVVSTKHAVSRELLASADEFIDLRDLKTDIARGQKESPSFSTGVTSSLSTAKQSLQQVAPYVKPAPLGAIAPFTGVVSGLRLVSFAKAK